MVKIAAQTYSLYQECSTDLCGTLQTLHQIGFQSIEPPLKPFITLDRMPNDGAEHLWSPETLETAYDLLQKLKMEIASVHIGVNFGWYALPIDVIQKNILLLHNTYGITDFVVSGAFSTVEKTIHWANLTQKISDAICDHGCRLLYHNHDDEFQKIDNRGEITEAIEMFLQLTSEDVLLQVDVGWAAIVTDATKFMQKYANRVGSIHLKDFYDGYQQYTRAEMPIEMFAPIGQGVIPIKEVISMLNCFSNFGGTVIIDQDQSTMILQDMDIGYRNITRTLSDMENNSNM